MSILQRVPEIDSDVEARRCDVEARRCGVEARRCGVEAQTSLENYG